MCDEPDITPPAPPLVRTVEIDDPGTRADLVALTGDLAGRRFSIVDRAVLGRDPKAAVTVEGNDVSRRHAAIWRTEAGEYVVQDLGSRNGTLVNGVPVEMRPLRFGDKIQIGTRTLFVFTPFQALEEQLVRWQRMELIAEMTAGVVHDFNNYMTALLGYVQYIQDRLDAGVSDAELRAVLGRSLPVMDSAGREGAALAQRVLGFARGSNRPQVPVNLSGILGEAIEVVRRTFGDAIEVSQSVEPELRLVGDRTEVLQVIINLLLNARDAMPQGGTIQLEARRLEKPPEDARAQGFTGPYIEVVVADTGTGMDEATRKRIFEPLFTTKRAGKGTGLGLSTVARIVEAHRGSVRVTSTPGKGTRFTIAVPAAEGLHRQISSSTVTVYRGAQQVERGGLALVVQTDKRMRERTARVAASHGLDIICTATGAEALSLFETYRDEIRLVVLQAEDLGDDVPALEARLREQDPGVKVLITTRGGEESRTLPPGLPRLRTPCRTEALERAVVTTLKAPREKD